MTSTRTRGLLGLMVAGALLVAPIPSAHADTGDDDSTTSSVCTGFRLGMSPSQIERGLQQNDGRVNPWQAQRDTIWPIVTGQCDG
jgi:hypothetical protein